MTTRTYNTRIREGFGLLNGELDTSDMTLPEVDVFVPSEETLAFMAQNAPTQTQAEADLNGLKIDF